MLLRRAICLALFAALAWPAAAQVSATVSTQYGDVRGTSDGAIPVFKGIPYAAPPVGALRWQPAQPPASWSGVLDATQFGNVCPQPVRAGYNEDALQGRAMDEDCLQLNVWTPDTAPSTPAPVMVWILPGGFTTGDTGMAVYNGRALAEQGMVTVTFNYRLGYLGQFAHPAHSRAEPDAAIGNYYLSDQVAALTWVRDNIAAFGGDPDNVTIFGMSAGGVSVNYLMAVPAAKGLFHKAMSQSSNVRPYKAKHISRDGRMSPSLETVGTKMAEAKSIAGDDQSVIAALRALPWQDVLAYQNENAFGSLNPAVDGTYLPEGLGPVFSQGRQHPVPYLTGAASWEGSLLARFDSADMLLNALGLSREEVRNLYGDVDERSILNNLEFDTFFGSQRWLARQHAKAGLPTYLYRFDYVYSAERGTIPGARHGEETPYVFKTLGTRIDVPPSDEDWAMSDLVSAYWVKFAKTGNPNGSGRPDWPLHTASRDVLLDFGANGVRPIEDHEKRRMTFMERRYSTGEM